MTTKMFIVMIMMMLIQLEYRQHWWKSLLEESSLMWCGTEWRYLHHDHQQQSQKHQNAYFEFLDTKSTHNHHDSPFSSRITTLLQLGAFLNACPGLLGHNG